MSTQWIQASGYLTIFLMPSLFVVGAFVNRPWLAFGVVVLVFPLARLILGAVPARGAPDWGESVATALDWLPVTYVPFLAACLFAGLHVGASEPAMDALSWLGLGFSLWMTLLFGTCVAHELIHRRDKHLALLGYMLAGLCGYPALGAEHLAHHARAGDSDRAEYPLKSESMWRFAGRRLGQVASEVLGATTPVWHSGRVMPGVARTRAALCVTALTAVAFVHLAGWRGGALYAAVIGGVAFGIQLITYIQHWGLGRDDIADRVEYGRGWEEDCQFQAWVTLAISLHDRHHQDSRVPYYRLSLATDSPRLPASYVLLMFLSMAPRLWCRTIAPVHARWMKNPSDSRSAGRRLTCFGLERG